MKKGNGVIYFLLLFIASLLAELYCMLQFRNDYITIIGVGIVTLIAAYLVMDGIKGWWTRYLNDRDDMQRVIQDELLEQLDERIKDSAKLQKALYVTVKKMFPVLEEEKDQIAAIKGEIVSDLSESQITAAKLIIKYNREDNRREVKAAKKRLWLNGEILFLKGANRHEAHPQFGAATPEALMVQDIQLLKSLNGNFFRGSHYQQCQRFLDYCDEMGVLVWEESLGWGNKPDEMSDPEFFRLQVVQTREMVRSSFNHPSVIIFAYMNENNSHTNEGKKLNDALIEAIKSQDSGRLVTFACNHNMDDLSNENTDIVSVNTYPGWIGSDAGTLENQKRLIDENVTKIVSRHRRLYPEKPIVVSEMGTTAIYGYHDPAAGQGTEEFQYYYNRDVLERIFADPEMAGLAFWHFADSRTYHRGGSVIRTKLLAENMAGLYDGYRRAKLAAHVVRDGFARKAAGESD